MAIPLPIVSGRCSRRRGRCLQKMPAKRELRRTMAVRKKAIMTNAMEAVGESVEQPRRPVSSKHRSNMPHGWMDCRKTCGTARSPRHYRRSAIWISPSFRRSHRHAASEETDHHRLAACTDGSTGTHARRCVSHLMGTPRRAGPPLDYPNKPPCGGSILDADRGSIFNAD